jgi:hypothetical protein
MLGIASLFLSPLWVLAGLAALALALAILKRPEFGLLIIVIIASGLVDYESLPLLSIGPASFHITDLGLLYLLALVLVRSLTIPGNRQIRTPLDIPLLFLFAAILISAIMAFVSPSVDKSWVLRRLRPLTYYLGFFCVTNLISSRKSLLFLLNGLYWIAVLASLVMILHVIAPSFQLIDTKSFELVTAGKNILVWPALIYKLIV